MALIQCSECGGDVSTNATACPHCGNTALAPIAEPTSTGAAAKSRPSFKLIGCTGCLGLIVALYIVGEIGQWFDERATRKAAEAQHQENVEQADDLYARALQAANANNAVDAKRLLERGIDGKPEHPLRAQVEGVLTMLEIARLREAAENQDNTAVSRRATYTELAALDPDNAEQWTREADRLKAAAAAEIAEDIRDGYEGKINEFAFISWCQRLARVQLKAPATAEFERRPEVFRLTGVKNAYIIKSYVDAQNSFGALMRNRFQCAGVAESADTFRLETFDFFGQ